MPRRILLLGGHGLVGSHITRLLAGAPGLVFLIAGRDAAAVGLFVEYLVEEGIDARAVACGARPGDLVAEARADLVIDATGSARPDHTTARACIAAHVPYLDISDDRETVLAIRALDAAARDVNVAVVSGAGVVPCLTMAACASLAVALPVVVGARIVLLRGNREEYGQASTAALLDHVGRRMRWRQGGAWETARAFQTVAPRDGGRYGGFRLLAYDAPELELLPEMWPSLRDATVWAGIELPALARGLRILGWMRPKAGFAARIGLFDTLARSFGHFGTARSRVRVELDGLVGGHSVLLSWTLVAKDGSGAWLRAAPAAAMARQMLQGVVRPGARVARLDLAEILVELRGRDILVSKTDMDR